LASTDARDAPDLRAAAAPLLLRLREADLGSGVSSAAMDVRPSASTDARDAPDLRAAAAPLLLRLREADLGSGLLLRFPGAVLFSGVCSDATNVSV
jgi:hypothetical protein